MEIRVLRYFLTVVREESITKAAEVLHITQPTLSRQLTQLEEETGVRFDMYTATADVVKERMERGLIDLGLLLQPIEMEKFEFIRMHNSDLNYNDSSTRATVEQGDDSARPAISGTVENMDDYDIIFVGYPIWWGQAPKIIYTFVESYDLSGKTIVPFCTSGSSGVGSSATNLHSSASDADWIDGTRFSSDASRSDIEEWLSGLPIETIEQ